MRKKSPMSLAVRIQWNRVRSLCSNFEWFDCMFNWFDVWMLSRNHCNNALFSFSCNGFLIRGIHILQSDSFLERDTWNWSKLILKVPKWNCWHLQFNFLFDCEFIPLKWHKEARTSRKILNLNTTTWWKVRFYNKI